MALLTAVPASFDGKGHHNALEGSLKQILMASLSMEGITKDVMVRSLKFSSSLKLIGWIVNL
jgi:hypothetical protein